MLKNNNQNAVKRISTRSLRYNRTRNMFAVLAVILTTFMFTTVFGIGFSLAKNMNVMMLREQGTKSTVYLQNPSAEQISQAEDCRHLNAAGIQIHADTAQSPENPETSFSLDYFDNTEFKKNFIPAISDMNGAYPAEENEIMLSKAALDSLNIIDPVINMDIVLQVGGEEKTFRLSGWFTDYGFTAGGSQCFVSKAYTEASGLTAEKNGRLSLSAKIASQALLIQELEEKVTLRSGQKIDSGYDVQDESVSNAVIVAVAIGLICLIILCSGYLLIYNVMYISVTKDIRFYGMLKTIGTSPEQIRKIVTMQAFRLSAVGIPIGILLGTLTSFAAVPYALDIFTSDNSGVMPDDISFNPFIYVGTILFGILTVAVSCRKPARLAAKISPVEALKFNGRNSNKIRPHRSTSGGKLYKMAFRNVFREKKKALLVFTSLFMGTMAFLSANTFIGSMKVENYVDYYLPNDYTLYISSSDDKAIQKKYTEAASKLAEDIAALDGIASINVNRSVNADLAFDENVFRPFLENAVSDEAEMEGIIRFYKENGGYSSPVIGVNSAMMEAYNKKAKKKIDVERFEKGEICFVGYVQTQEESEEMTGRTITITDNDTGNSVSLEVGTCPVYDDCYGINLGYYWYKGGAPDCILVSQGVIDKLNSSPATDNIIIDCKPEAESYITAEIRKMIKTNTCIMYGEIKSEQIQAFKSSMMAMNILSAGISIVLILIGIINFINVMLTGVFARRKELAVMESVGMTKKQVRKMLMYEGMYYGLITILLILTLGSGIIYCIAHLAKMTADYAVFHYPWQLMLEIAAVIMAICVTVPGAVYKTLSKESVTERLHNTD